MVKRYKELPFEKWVTFVSRNKNSQQLKELIKMSMADYSDLEKEIKESEEPKILKAGTEVKARIVSVRSGVSDKNDCTWYTPIFDVPDDPMVMEFNDFFWDLGPDNKAILDPKQWQRNRYNFSQFAAAFGIDYSRPFDWEDDLPGKTGWMILGVRKSEEYGDSNSVKKYVVGKKGK